MRGDTSSDTHIIQCLAYVYIYVGLSRIIFCRRK